MQHYCSQCGKLMDNDNNYICIDCFKKTNNLTDTNTEYTNTVYKNSNRVRNNDENKKVTEVKKVEIHLNNTKADDFLNFRNMDNKNNFFEIQTNSNDNQEQPKYNYYNINYNTSNTSKNTSRVKCHNCGSNDLVLQKKPPTTETK